jgi:hypothetical protein
MKHEEYEEHGLFMEDFNPWQLSAAPSARGSSA